MPDLEIVIEKLDAARTGLNNARNAAEQWRQGKVANVNLTAAQKTALRGLFEDGIQKGKDSLAEVEFELTQ